jgi:hypothetical protein
MTKNLCAACTSNRQHYQLSTGSYILIISLQYGLVLYGVHSQRSESHAAIHHTQTLGAGAMSPATSLAAAPTRACQGLHMPIFETIEFGS